MSTALPSPVTEKPEPTALKSETKTYIEVDYGDLEKKIKEVYRQEFCFVSSEECSNYCSISFPDIGEEKADLIEIDVFKLKGQDHTSLRARDLLNHMAEKGHIQKGDYLINVFW